MTTINQNNQLEITKFCNFENINQKIKKTPQFVRSGPLILQETDTSKKIPTHIYKPLFNKGVACEMKKIINSYGEFTIDTAKDIHSLLTTLVPLKDAHNPNPTLLNGQQEIINLCVEYINVTSIDVIQELPEKINEWIEAAEQSTVKPHILVGKILTPQIVICHPNDEVKVSYIRLDVTNYQLYGAAHLHTVVTTSDELSSRVIANLRTCVTTFYNSHYVPTADINVKRITNGIGKKSTLSKWMTRAERNRSRKEQQEHNRKVFGHGGIYGKNHNDDK